MLTHRFISQLDHFRENIGVEYKSGHRLFEIASEIRASANRLVKLINLHITQTFVDFPPLRYIRSCRAGRLCFAHIKIDNIHNDWNSGNYGTAIAKTAVVAGGTGLAAVGAAYAAIVGLEAVGITIVAGGTGAVAIGAQAAITFGHGARHLGGTGLAQDVVEGAIKSDILSRGGAGGLGETVERILSVQGADIIYRANMWKDGIINVGTYFLK